jgi:hypothetical protein
MKGIRYNLKTEWRVQKRPHKMTESETDRQTDRQTDRGVYGDDTQHEINNFAGLLNSKMLKITK